MSDNKSIDISSMAPHVHSFVPNENKVNKITQWLAEWIKTNLEKNIIKPGDFLPSKGDLAFHIGVSIGTIQNVYRNLEDMGLIESRQKIGSYIKNNNSAVVNCSSVSKRIHTAQLIKKYIKNNCSIGDKMPSIRQLSSTFNIPLSTVKSALAYLINEDILSVNYLVKTLNFDTINTDSKTLTDELCNKIEEYILKNNLNGKIPSNIWFAKYFNVSEKTVFDAVKILKNNGKIVTYRGKYGKVTSEGTVKQYEYEVVESKIINFITDNCQVNSKIPPIRELAKLFNTSTTTIKKALDDLADDSIVAFIRGRNGGTFVINIPNKDKESYTWLALNPEFLG